jgi:hypothetical protein
MKFEEGGHLLLFELMKLMHVKCVHELYSLLGHIPYDLSTLIYLWGLNY